MKVRVKVKAGDAVFVSVSEEVPEFRVWNNLGEEVMAVVSDEERDKINVGLSRIIPAEAERR